jgi:hypothetical protein
MDAAQTIAKLRALLDGIDTDDQPSFEEVQQAFAEYNALKALAPEAVNSDLENALIDIELDQLEATLARLGHGEEGNGRSRKQ